MQMYKSNPAGESKGRFWTPIPMLAVNKSIREEAGYMFENSLIDVKVSAACSPIHNKTRRKLTRNASPLSSSKLKDRKKLGSTA